MTINKIATLKMNNQFLKWKFLSNIISHYHMMSLSFSPFVMTMISLSLKLDYVINVAKRMVKSKCNGLKPIFVANNV